MLGQEGFVDIQVLHRQGVSITGIVRGNWFESARCAL